VSAAEPAPSLSPSSPPADPDGSDGEAVAHGVAQHDVAPSVAAVAAVAAPESVPGSEGAHYVLGSYLTEGGMAAVYLGKRKAQGGFEKEVVLKRLRPELLHRPGLLELLLREARLAAGLEHPGIVRTLDLAQLDGDYFLVMEYVRGGDLRLLLKRARRLGRQFSVQAALLLGRELLNALDYAHRYRVPGEDGGATGIVHRDVSPANILVSIAGEVKLTDFGIAVAGAQPLAEEQPLRVRGKIGYMAPEQARGEAVDARSDLFSLAAVLYEVLTLKRLFVGQEGQRPAQIYAEPITPPSRLCALPPEGDAIFLKALALDPAERYQSARDFYDALLGLTRRHGLWLDRAELAQHLRDVCGDDPGAWSMIEERSSTAVLALIPDPGEPDGDVSGLGDVGERATEPWEQEAAHTPAHALGASGPLGPLDQEPAIDRSIDEGWLAAASGAAEIAAAAESFGRARPGASGEVAEHDLPITAPWPTLPRGSVPAPEPLRAPIDPKGPPTLSASPTLPAALSPSGLARPEATTLPVLPAPAIIDDTQPLPSASLPEASEVAAPLALAKPRDPDTDGETARAERVELTEPVVKEPAPGSSEGGGELVDQTTTARHRATAAPAKKRRTPKVRTPAGLLVLILLAMLLGALLATAHWLITRD
jgi:serine/threonine-protein kinase